MKLKLDEKGNVVVEDGKPVYVYKDDEDNEQEMAFDAVEALSKNTALGKENAKHRGEKKEALEKLALFGDLDPEKAKKALETVANFEAKKLIDAGEVDKLKTQLGEIFDQEKATLVSDFEKKSTESAATIAEQDGTIRHLILSNKFAQSPFFSGAEPKTILPPDMGATFFGENFKVEGTGKDVTIVGYLNGEKILSTDPQKLGQAADFGTAIEKIVNAYPDKNRIMRSTPGGPGGNANNANLNGNAVTISRADAKIPANYQTAKAQATKLGVPLRIQ